MAFSRDDISAYEAQTPTKVADDIGTAFKPAASAAAPSAPASKPANAKPAAVQPADDVETTTEETPASDETDPAESGGEPSADTPADSATANAQPEGETSTSDEDGNQPPPKGSARERIEDLVAERNALRKYVQYREELWKGQPPAQAAGEVAPTAAAPVAPTVAPDPEPNLETMNYDLEAFNTAHKAWVQRQIDFGVKQKLQEERAKQEKTAAEQEALTVRAGFEERAEKFAATHTDFKAVILNPALPQLHPRAAGAMVRSDQSAAILYHLGKNPDFAARVARMTPDQQVMQIGRIEGIVSSQAPAPKPQKQKVSNAPPPPTTTTGGTSRGKDPTDPSMSMDEFVALDRADRQRQREQRNTARDSMRGRR